MTASNITTTSSMLLVSGGIWNNYYNLEDANHNMNEMEGGGGGGGGIIPPPKSLSEALDKEDPLQALGRLALASERRSEALAADLSAKLAQLSSSSTSTSSTTSSSSNMEALNDNFNFIPTSSIACSESIYHSLTKIASGGAEASHEIRELEQLKEQVDQHAFQISLALSLRNAASQASAALQNQDYMLAAQSIRPWLQFNNKYTTNTTKRNNNENVDDEEEEEEKKQVQIAKAKTRAYVGESAAAQLEETHSKLVSKVTLLYKKAVQEGDLATLGKLTPVLATIRLEDEAVQLYLQFLKTTLQQSLVQPPTQQQSSSSAAMPVHAKLAKIYNLAVQTLRHHLPLVSHCLWQASGDVAVLQLIHALVQDQAMPLLTGEGEGENDAARRPQWKTVTPAAAAIASAIAERVTGHGGGGGMVEDYAALDDCGFSARIGSLSDVNLAMDETALLLQHSESYLRFLTHCCREINKARQLRGFEETQEVLFHSVLDKTTLLHQSLAELGGEYATVEHCLLLASMQRSFAIDPKEVDPRQYYRPLLLSSSSNNSSGGGSGSGATADISSSSRGGVGGASNTTPSAVCLQTSVMDTCWYSTRKSTQRAFATGHTGTASAMVNFAVDALQVLLEVASQRAEDAVSQLESLLLVGWTGSILSVVIRSTHHHAASASASAGSNLSKDELLRKQHEASQGIARACAALNDLEVAVSLSTQLESLLSDTTAAGFPQEHATEQLLLCVRSIGAAVTESFRTASNAAIDSLNSVLKPRIRSILGETILEGGSSSAAAASSATTTFMSSSVMKGSGGGDRVLSRMNYNLNDEKYNLLQASEGYVTRLTTALDELLQPLRLSLAPRLWDKLLLDVLGTVAKRLEASLRKCEFTSLGALALDADMRDLVSYAKERLYSPDYASNVAVTRASIPLARLLQIAKLLNVDELDDVLDLISSSKRKSNWDLKLEDTRAFLSARVEFETQKVNELLRLRGDD